MKFFMCLVLLAVVAVNADDEAIKETVESAEASQSVPFVLPSPTPLRPKTTYATYKPKVNKPIQPTYAPLLSQKPKVYVVPTTLRPLRPKPTLAPYNPIPKVIKPIQTTYKPLKVIPTVPRGSTIKPNYQNDQSGAYVPWKEAA